MSEETAPTTEEGQEGTKPQGLDAYLEALDDDGRKAVKAELDKARRQTASYRERVKDAEARVQQLSQTQQQGEQQQAQADAETARRLQALFERSARAEIKAAAAAKFTDPEDAAVYLKPSDYIDENGDVRSDELSAAIDDLLERKPHLAKQPEKPGTRQPAPDRGQGRTGGQSAEPADVFGAWLKSQLPSLRGGGG